jgi:hypothetical protein
MPSRSVESKREDAITLQPRGEDDGLQLPSPTATSTATASSGNRPATDVRLDPITSTPPKFVVTETISKGYYKGLPSRPPLIATTRPGPFEVPTGPEAYFPLKHLRVLGDHPLAKVWDEGLAVDLCRGLNAMSVKWTSLDAIRIVTAGESSSPAIIWIGVDFNSLTFEEGSVIAYKCRPIVDGYGISNYHVEIRESRVRKLSGCNFLEPVPFSDPTFTAREPFTATLGIPVAAMNRSSQGTGGFFISAGGDDPSIYLVTARHVVLPAKEGNQPFVRKNNSQPRTDIVVLSDSGFNEKIVAIDEDIKEQQSKIIDAMERYEMVKDADDSRSVKESQAANHGLQHAREVSEGLSDLHHEIAAHWSTKTDRIFGELVWSPPITLSTKPGEFTLDFAVIKIDPGKLNRGNYRGNCINIGDKYTRYQFLGKVYSNGTSPTSFKFPPDRLAVLQGQVPEDCVFQSPMLDSNGDQCLVVFKNGAKTGVTIGKANNAASFIRCCLDGEFVESREWPVVPYDNHSGTFSEGGDSGSCVADAFGRIGGIITGGTDSLTYVTPISSIMKALHGDRRFKYAHLNPVLA